MLFISSKKLSLLPRYSQICILLSFAIVKTASKKIGALICSMKFLSPEVALYLYKFTIRPCVEYCCPVWAGPPSCYLELLDKLQKQICRTVGPSRATSLESLNRRPKCSQLKSFL